MTKLYIYWDDWYTWFAGQYDSLATERVIEVPQDVADRYWAALNAYHDAREKVREYMS